jgi:hypothetical protein
MLPKQARNGTCTARNGPEQAAIVLTSPTAFP